MRPVWPLTFAVCFQWHLWISCRPQQRVQLALECVGSILPCYDCWRIAPFLKLGVNTWTSTRISGQAMSMDHRQCDLCDSTESYDICEPWPAISPVINAIGALEALAQIDTPFHCNMFELESFCMFLLGSPFTLLRASDLISFATGTIP